MFLHLPWNNRKGYKKLHLHRVAFNLAALFVIALTIAAPLEPAFAQSADASATDSNSTTSGTSALSPDQPSVDTSTAQPSTTESAPTILTTPSTGAAQDQSSAPASTPPSTPPPASPPNAPTAPDIQPLVYSSFNQNQVKIDKNTGALNMAFPIDIPPGRNGLQPDLSLFYNSQNSQQGSIFGEGWAIGIPYIERLNKSGVDNLYSTSSLNYFTSSLDGELVATSTVSSTASSYVARTDNGAFNKYVFTTSTSQWTMTDKNGTQYVFGSTSDSQQSDPNNSAHVYKWMLKTVTDENNNTVTYNYVKDSGQIYPSSTLYTGTATSTGVFEVDFQLATTTLIDNGTSSATGFAVNSNYRVSEIDAKVNGTWVRKYALGYTVGDNGYTTLLNAITESGQNASGTIVILPAATFAYQLQTPGWTSSSTWNPPTPFVTSANVDTGVRIANLTGNGLPGIISSSSAWIDNGSSWTSSSTWISPVSLVGTGGSDSGHRLADVTGNGLFDIITCGTSYLNTGAGWATSSTWNSPICFASNGLGTGAIMADVNGDGLPDIISGSSSGTPSYAAYINNGHGWATSTIWTPPLPFVSSGGIDAGTRIADVNGDGLADILQNYSDASGTVHSAAYVNIGNGWATSTVWNPPASSSFITSGGWDNGVRIADVNGDGLPDIISSYTDINGASFYAAYLNTGHGWTSDAIWAPPTVFDTNGGYDQGARILDVVGSGLPGIISGYIDFQGVNQYAAWVNNNASRPDLLTSLTYPQGGNSSIQYVAAAQSSYSSGATTNYVPYPVYTAAKITTSDGLGNTASSLSYQYSGGAYYYNGPYDHQFAGFSTVTQTDAAGNVTKTYYHTSNGTDSAHGEYNDNFWKIGKPYRIENYDNSSDLYKKVINRWDSVSLGGNAAFVKLASSTEADYDGLSTHTDLAESYAYDAATGNRTQKVQWGQVTANDDGTFNDISTSTDELTTNYSYASSSTSTVIGKLSDETLLNQSSTKIQETQYFYDNAALGGVSKGNLTKQLDWKSGSTYITTVQNTYNGYGLVTKTLDPRNNTSTFSYDSYNLYPATSTNALSQSTGYQYDYSTGKPTQTIDPNGLRFQTSYDGLGRPLTLLQPDQVTTSTLDTKTTYAYTDTSNAVSVHESDSLTATTTVDTYRYYDGLNRIIQTRKSATDAGIYKVADKAYNNIGSVQKESLPYFASGTVQTAATATIALFAIYTYDPLGRVTQMSNAVGTTTTAYANWKITTTDANGNPKDTYDDAYGNLVQVGEHNLGGIYTTSYAYDGLRDLTNITDANANVRSFAYDGLGRMVSSTDLHVPTSSSYGIWTYAYDDAGNLTTKVDPKNQTITYGYDNLNRVTSETASGTTQIAYTYDSCANGIGHLCTVSSTDAVSLLTRTYDPEGNLASETRKIDGTNYATSYAYDRQGNQLTITNPDNSIVQYVYGSGGLVTSVQEKESSSTFVTLVSNIDYSPMDKMATQTDANGVTTVNTYDSTRLYRLYSTVTTDNGSGFPMAPLHGGSSGRSGPLSPGGSSTYTCTGAETSYTVPTGTTKLYITAFGAQGAANGGLGGEVSSTLTVTGGTKYYINVGCQNGYNGGGAAGASYLTAGNGGGMTWLSANSFFTTTTVLLVAGGGGGKGGQGNNPGTGSPGDGGTGGGSTGGAGGTGSSAYCGINECAGGGGGGAQSAGGSAGNPAGQGGFVGVAGSAGQGGFGGDGYRQSSPLGGGGGGGGGGFYGGGGGAGGGFNSGGYMAGGGGGGASYIAQAAALTATSTVSGVNSGDGSLTITPVQPLTNLNQYLLNSTTTLNEGSSTNTGVTFSATLTSGATTTLQLQIEVEPTGTAFTGIPNVTSSAFVSPGSTASTTFTGITGGYHWQARQNSSLGSSTVWQVFGPSATSTDFILDNTITETYTGSVQSFTVPLHVKQLILTANGAQGNAGGGSHGGSGANGGQVVGTLANPIGTYYYWVGQQGGGASGGAGAQGGGNGGPGGGYTWFSTQNTFDVSHVIVVGAGGGGGGGDGITPTGGGGGTGGGASGSAGGDGGGSFFGRGGSGGSQSAGGNGGAGAGCVSSGGNGSSGTGGAGTAASNPSGVPAGGGGGGGYGYYGGGGGGAINGCNISGGGGAGGGGSSYVSSGLTATSTSSGAKSGNGSLSITEVFDPVPVLSSSSQYRADGVTVITSGSSTSQATVVFSAVLNSWTGRSLQLQVEVQPSGTAFTNSPNVSSSPFVSPSSIATTSFSTAVNGGYHWQARAIDAQNNVSQWQIFAKGGSATTTTFTYTGAVQNWTVPTGVASMTVMTAGAQGGSDISAFIGGAGGTATGTLSVTAGSVYNYCVGGGGQNANGSSIAQGGFCGGGSTTSTTSYNGGGGGGASWFGFSSSTYDANGVYTSAASTTMLLIGPGGGGNSANTQAAPNGNGGGLTGSTGDTQGGACTGGSGGTQSAGGAGGNSGGTAGSAGKGGTGGGAGGNAPGGGGGAGLFGGGGGGGINGSCRASGGGGSAFMNNRFLTATSTGAGLNQSTGTIAITYRLGAATSTDFVIAVPQIAFTFPTQGTTTQNFSNWQLKADAVTSTDSYSLRVNWDDAMGDPAQSSTITASGTALLSGVNVPKPTSSLDYTFDADPVAMNATATLQNASATITIATSSVNFTEVTTSTPVSCGTHQIQCIVYKYDNNGNITQITDNSASNAAITVTYSYDALNRLTAASSTNAASGQNYTQTFTYDPIGNILSGPAGNYTYSGTGYPNPDALTGFAATSTNTTPVVLSLNYTGAIQSWTVPAYVTSTLLNVSGAAGGSSTIADIAPGNGWGGSSTGTLAVSQGQVYYYCVGGQGWSPGGMANNNAGGFCGGANGGTGPSLDGPGGGGMSWLGTANAFSRATALLVGGGGAGGNNADAGATTETGGGGGTSGENPVDPQGQCTSGTTTGGSQSAGGTAGTGSGGSGSAGTAGNGGVGGTTGSGRGGGGGGGGYFGGGGGCAGTTGRAQAGGGGSSFASSTTILSATSTASALNQATGTITLTYTPSIVLNSTTTYAYDHNGNLLSNGNATDTWNYRNELTQSQTPSGTSSYAYDYLSNRMKITIGTSTTVFPTVNYNAVEGGATATTTKYIYANGLLVATITDASSTSKARYIHNDYLGGTNLVTDSSGVIQETLQYFPYGSVRLDSTTSTYGGERRKYIGQQYDAPTALLYDNARYYNGSQGQFLSEDPLFLAMGDPNHLLQHDQNSLLADPQSLNPYSYAKDNPITSSDPTGLTVILESIAWRGSNGTYVSAHTFFFVSPDHPDEIQISGVPANSTAFTFSGEPSGSGFPGSGSMLTKQVNADLKNASNYSRILNEKIIRPPDGQSDTQFVDNLGAQFNALKLNGISYSFSGANYSPGQYSGNSNNFAYTLGVNSGVQNQLKSFNPTPSPSGYSMSWAPGWGAVLPGQNAPARYTFSGGVNVYGESYASVFGNSNSTTQRSN